MIIGYEEAKKVDGYFYEFEYQTRIKRTKNSEHFACFKNNDLQIYVLKSKIYFRHEKDFEHTTNNWNGQDLFGIYSYFPIGKTNNKKLNSFQVIEKIFTKENNYRLASLITIGSIDYIQ